MRVAAPSFVYTPSSSTVASPYRRPTALQPLRQLAAVVALLLAPCARQLPRVGVDIEIREAAGRGLGLFAARNFEPDEIVGFYTGAISPPVEADQAMYEGRTSGAYLLLVPWGQTSIAVDAEPDAQRCPASYMNHSVRRQNCAFDDESLLRWLPNQPYVRVTRRVAVGQELLVDYGSEYWDNRGLRAPNPRRFIVDYW